RIAKLGLELLADQSRRAGPAAGPCFDRSRQEALVGEVESRVGRLLGRREPEAERARLEHVLPRLLGLELERVGVREQLAYGLRLRVKLPDDLLKSIPGLTRERLIAHADQDLAQDHLGERVGGRLDRV